MLQQFRKKLKSPRLKELIIDIIDPFFKKQRDKIFFVVQDQTVFSGNLRVMCEKYVKENNGRIFVYKDGKCLDEIKKELVGMGVKVIDNFSLSTIYHIVTSGVVFLSHNPRNIHISRKFSSRLIINLWHGVAIKKIENSMQFIPAAKQKLLNNHARLYDMVIASSEADKETNIKAFGVTENKVKVTGLPRYEILKEHYTLGKVLKNEELKIENIKKGRKLVLYASTFREDAVSPLQQLSCDEWIQLEKFAEKHNLLIGIRPHPYDLKELPDAIKGSEHFYLFSNECISEPNILLKHVDILIVDFTSIWVDYLLLNKPIIGFAKDYENYLTKERGFVYDFNKIFPDRFTDNIYDLLTEMEIKLSAGSTVKYEETKKVLHKYDVDDNCAQLVYREVEKLRRKFLEKSI
jgi:CDP-glycerol glycerophosphotransferase (TagB/SpsB family)